jgi:hypothetical protein
MKVSALVAVLVLIATSMVAANVDEHVRPYEASRTILLQRETINTAGFKANSVAADRDSSGLYLVQLKSVGFEATKRAVEHIVGHSLVHYIPHNSFVIAGDASVARTVSATHGVLWVGPYRSTYRLSQELDSVMCTASDAEPPRVLDILFAPPGISTQADLENLAAKWQAAAGIQMISGSTLDVASVRVSCSSVARAASYLSRQREVLYVEPRPEYRTLNYYANGIVQSGGLPTNVPVWNKGLQGQNQVVGCALCFYVPVTGLLLR